MLRRWITQAVLVLVLCGLTGAAVAAPSGDEGRARELFRKAEIQFNLQQFARALDLYTEAYKLEPLPGFLFNIAQCQRYLGKYEEALFSYKIYRVRVPDPPNREQVERLIEETEKLLARQKAGQDPAPPTPASQPGGSTDGSTDRPLDEDENSDGPRALWVWAGISVFAALIATGVVTGQMTDNRAEEYKDPATPIERRQDLKDSGERLRTGSIVSFSLAGATAIATSLYYYLGYRAKRRRPRMTALPTVGGGTFSISGEF